MEGLGDAIETMMKAAAWTIAFLVVVILVLLGVIIF